MILKSKVIHNMKIDFNEIEPMTIPGMNGGIGMMTAKMYNDENYRIIPTGKAICDGVEEELRPGVMHICPKGSEHTIINNGEDDLVMLTIVVAR